MRKILFSLLMIISLQSKAQPSITWQKCIGGSTLYDFGQSIQQTTDGGYILSATSNGINDDFRYKKLNSLGSILWSNGLGYNGLDAANEIKQTTDGGYIIIGQTNSTNISGYHGAGDILVAKLDSQGSSQWIKCLGGSGGENSSSIQQTTDGGYILSGSTNSSNGDVLCNPGGGGDAWIVKLTNLGEIQWQKCLGGSLADSASEIKQTTDGGYILSGSTNSSNGDFFGNHGGGDAWIVKLTNLGEIQWQKCLGGSLADSASEIKQTTDGGYILSGSTNSSNGDVSGNHGGSDIWVVKLSNLGGIQWQKCLGGSNNEYSSSIQQTMDGGYIICGTTFSNNGDVSGNNGDRDVWVVKLSNLGGIQWQKCLGGSNDEYSSSIQQTMDGGYIICGTTFSNNGDVSGNNGNSDIWVVKLFSDILTSGFCQSMSFSDLSNMPTSRGLIASATDGTNIYVCNGFSPTVSYTTQIEKYNIATNAWSTFSNINAGLRYGSAEIVGNKLYVFNGIPDATTFNNNMEVIDLSTGVVTYSSVNPSPVRSAGSTVWNGKIYSFGGRGSAGYSDKLYVFDPVMQTWTALANMPQAKEAKGEVINGKLYVIGGFNSLMPSYSTSIDCYDIQTNTWSHIMDMPASNSANSTSVDQNKIWVIGDYDNLTFVGYYDVLTNQFVSIQSNIIGRRHASSIVLNNNLYAFGGNQTSLADSCLNSLQVANIADFTSVPNVGYLTPQSYQVGTAIIPLTPINTSGSCSLMYTISPTLPSGLTLDPATGIISGTPLVASPMTTFSMTGCNGFVCVTSTLVLSTITLGTAVFSDTSLKLYPNPTHSLINIQTSNSIVLDKITITDLTGKIVMEQTQNTNQVSVEKLSTGVYILNGFSQGNKFQEKFIKE